MKGIIKYIGVGKNFGFIRASDGVEYFFHRDDFRNDWFTLIDKIIQEKVEVTFDSVESTKGPRASNVRMVEDNGNS